MPYAEADKIAKLIPNELNITLDRALQIEPELGNLYKNEPNVKKLIDISRRLEGLTRHASKHAAGIVRGSPNDKVVGDFSPVLLEPFEIGLESA